MDSAVAAIAEWMPQQRWYGGKGRAPLLRRIGAFELPAPVEPDARALTLLLMDDASEPPILYQVPVVERTVTTGDEAAAHLIAHLDDDTLLFDGPHDPCYTDALLAMIVGELEATPDGVEASGHVSGPTTALPAVPRGTPATVLGGEQSNTSIIYRPHGVTPIICKVYRQLHHGENPDVTLQTALAASGSAHVPASIGDVIGEWDDVGRPNGRARGHLAFAQEFLPGVEDAWKVALRAAQDGVDFAARAEALGQATANVHRTLAEVMATREPSLGDTVAAVSTWHQRLAIAIHEVPQIAEHRAAIEAVYDTAQQSPWPRLQRIHGDYHLGQVLAVPGRGWVLLDFEGEPLRPMHERDQLDSPLRDVAGMLRSFDYVAGSTALTRPGTSAAGWASDARRAFLDGYIAASGHDLRAHRALLDAFEIDKAVYEAVYEARNRPDWLPIPLAAVARLASRGMADTSA